MESSGEETPCLPEQVIMEEILTRLPVKSLLKFRCVSKSWCSLIGSKKFIKSHLKYSIKSSRFTHQWIYFHAVGKLFKQCPLPSLFDNPFTVPIAHNVDLGIDFKREYVSPVGCCNGLVCILAESGRFVLWNPTTKKFKNVPDFSNEMSRVVSSKCGFGFDELNDDYKVFVVFNCDVTANVAIGKVYSLKSNSWKDIEERDVSRVHGVGVYLGGKLHWNSYEGYIVSFDLNRHVYGVVELPSYTKGILCSLGVLGGCLSAHFYHPNWVMDAWVMKEYGVKESWGKVVTVPHYDQPDTCEILTPLDLAPNGEVLLVYNSNMVIYNPNSDMFRKPHIPEPDDMFACILCMGIYIESLASVES